MLDVGWILDVGWMVGESGIKANSAQFSWSLAKLGKNGKDYNKIRIMVTIKHGTLVVVLLLVFLFSCFFRLIFYFSA